MATGWRCLPEPSAGGSCVDKQWTIFPPTEAPSSPWAAAFGFDLSGTLCIDVLKCLSALNVRNCDVGVRLYSSPCWPSARWSVLRSLCPCSSPGNLHIGTPPARHQQSRLCHSTKVTFHWEPSRYFWWDIQFTRAGFWGRRWMIIRLCVVLHPYSWPSLPVFCILNHVPADPNTSDWEICTHCPNAQRGKVSTYWFYINHWGREKSFWFNINLNLFKCLDRNISKELILESG